MRRRALWIAALLAACDGEPPLPASWPLETVAQPWRETEARELGPRDSCRRLEDGRLFVEPASDPAGIQSVTRLWIEFRPPLLPRVEVANWNEETSTGARWTRRDFRGQAWFGSDGMGLGQPGGPDLIVDSKGPAGSPAAIGPAACGCACAPRRSCAPSRARGRPA